MSKSIWELDDKDFYLLCRRIEAMNVLRSRSNRAAIIRRMARDKMPTSAIARTVGLSIRQVQKIRKQLNIAAPIAIRQT